MAVKLFLGDVDGAVRMVKLLLNLFSGFSRVTFLPEVTMPTINDAYLVKFKQVLSSVAPPGNNTWQV